MSKVAVNIFGQSYNISGDESEEKILKVASLVDSKMKDIHEQADRSLPLAYLAVLSSINIANDLLQTEEESEVCKNMMKQMEGDVKHYDELWNHAKEELEKLKKENEFLSSENEKLKVDLKNKEKENKSLAFDQGSVRNEIRKGVEAQLKESEGRYKDLENNFFDLQMENIKMKSELEKLRGEMK